MHTKLAILAVVLVIAWWWWKTSKQENFAAIPVNGAKSGQMEITVANVQQSAAKVYEVATRYNGSIVYAVVMPEGADITLSVGANSFSAAFEDLRAVGKVEAESVMGQDAAAALETLNKMLVALQTHRDIIQRMIADAKTTEDALKLQQQLQKIQMSIAVVESQISAINAAVTKSFIAVSLYPQQQQK